MWIVTVPDNGKSFIARNESEIQACRDCGFEVTEVVPAADLAAERDMVQRLANELHDEYARRHARDRAPTTREQSTEFADWSMKEIGLHEVNGKWERVN